MARTYVTLDREPYVVGSTYRFQDTLTLDGSTWNLTGATVLFCLRDPSGNVTESNATLVTAASGIVRYDTLTTDLDEAGLWTRSWKVTLSGVVQENPPVGFRVYASP